MDSVNTDRISRLVLKFNSLVFNVLKLCKEREPNNIDLEFVQNKIRIARGMDPTLIIRTAEDKLWHYREQIVQKDLDFFLNNKFVKFVKNDENKGFMNGFIGLIKSHIKQMSENELEYIWVVIQKLLALVIIYKKININQCDNFESEFEKI
jgi:hypothetical protein